MTTESIKEAIEHLPDQDRRKLADWFSEVEEREWDSHSNVILLPVDAASF